MKGKIERIDAKTSKTGNTYKILKIDGEKDGIFVWKPETIDGLNPNDMVEYKTKTNQMQKLELESIEKSEFQTAETTEEPSPLDYAISEIVRSTGMPREAVINKLKGEPSAISNIVNTLMISYDRRTKK